MLRQATIILAALALAGLGAPRPVQADEMIETRIVMHATSVQTQDVGDVDGCLRDSFPETKTVGPGVVANEVQRDPHEPGRDRAIASKGMASGPGADEGVLG